MASVMLGAALSSCATRQAPGLHGRWKAVNHYAETTQAIPLRQAYVFHPSPLDGTLKAMLTRWAKDSGNTLSYSHPYDFTLHAPVTRVRTSDLREAVQRLTEIYAPQRVSITARSGQIIVNSADSSPIAETPAALTNAKN